MHQPTTKWLVLAAIVSSLGVARTARADVADECASAAEDAQPLLTARKVREARTKLLVCGREQCPSAVRNDCVRWLADVEASIPTVVIGARDVQGRSILDVRVVVDGKPFLPTLDGRAEPINPGPHTFTYERSGYAPIVDQVLVLEGEKRRIITVVFPVVPNAAPPAGAEPRPSAPPPASAVSVGPAAGAGPGSAPAGADHATTRGPISPLIYPVAILGVAGAATFATLGILGKNELADLHAGCGQTRSCAQSDVDATHTKLLVADISLGVSIVAVGVATYLVLARPTLSASASTAISRRPALRADVVPVRGGSMAVVGADF